MSNIIEYLNFIDYCQKEKIKIYENYQTKFIIDNFINWRKQITEVLIHARENGKNGLIIDQLLMSHNFLVKVNEVEKEKIKVIESKILDIEEILLEIKKELDLDE